MEGSESAVRDITERMRKGPSDARVDDVDVRDAELDGFTRFEVRH